MTPRRKRLGVIAGVWDPLDPIETTMTLTAVNISLIYTLLVALIVPDGKKKSKNERNKKGKTELKF